MKKVSIIVPCREIDFMTGKCIIKCLKLDYEDFEILILPDTIDREASKKYKDKKLRIIETGPVKPAFKRNLGMEKSKGNFFAFIDSDAYPEKDWLKNAMQYFKEEKIGIVGGPNLTPTEGNFWEKISGYVLSNFWTSGDACVRYKKSKNCFVKELPSCNYISRKEISPKYDPSFLTAEDSEFCFKVEDQGYKILYAKDVVVFHHRRDTLKKHLKQMFIYGRDIAWLSKKKFTLDKFYYSVLSIFTLGVVGGIILSFFSSIIKVIFLFLMLIYLLIIFSTSIHKNINITFWITTTTILTHFYYGFGWIYGILFKNKNIQANRGLNIR
ncbi:MAG: glycosyltransferase [Nanoarchaeota archaeon]|nr:glycosyltransferase [Nanoarchaeota archaeon]MBU1028282.1 glycosyltransferase [Nanoarchaeota archaeon]